MAMSCDICCETFTNKLRIPIKCDYQECQATICLQCFRRGLIMEGSEQECMACKQPISTEFIFLNTPKVFRDEYVNRMVELDMIKERALLKATKERMVANTRVKILNSRITALSSHLKKCSDDDEMTEILNASIEERRKLNNVLGKSDEEIIIISKSYLCPLNNNCSGLVENGRCGDCKKNICAKCRDERLDDHECNAQELETIKLLKRDTKPCPKCKVQIHKIDGCDQMFCTKCKTAFSWRTLDIQKGLIHNPHYHEYMNQIGGANAPPPGRGVIEIEAYDAYLGRGIIHIGIDANDPCGAQLGKALDYIQKEVVRKQEVFLPRILNEINAILGVLADDVHDDETISQSKRVLREAYLTQIKEGVKKGAKKGAKNTPDQAEANWYNQLRLMFKRREQKKDLIKIFEMFDRGLKDFIIMGYENHDYKAMYSNIDNLMKYFRTQLTENEKRHNLKNKTEVSFERGLQCQLIRY